MVAEDVKQNYVNSGNDALIGELITNKLAPATGFFSVWMTVFSEYPGMLTGFIAAFPGTAQDCFDINGAALPRPNGRI